MSDWRKHKLFLGLAALLISWLSSGVAAPAQAVVQEQHSQGTSAVQDRSVISDPAPGISDGKDINKGKKNGEEMNVEVPPFAVPNASSTTPALVTDAQESSSTPPVGTAAAPYEKPIGSAATRPAGAAIAPAKQKRSMSFKVRIAIVVGAVVAVGSVVALSMASPGSSN